jgi:glycerol-3-phosphate O-acyltransferase
MKTETREVTPFDSIELRAFGTMSITQGEKESLTLEVASAFSLGLFKMCELLLTRGWNPLVRQLDMDKNPLLRKSCSFSVASILIR